MAGTLDGPPERSTRVLGDELHQPQTHPAAGSMNSQRQGLLAQRVVSFPTPMTATSPFILIAPLVSVSEYRAMVRIMSSRSFGNNHRSVREPGAANSAAAENLLKIVLVGAVVGDGRGRILELVASQDADHALGRGDDSLLA